MTKTSVCFKARSALRATWNLLESWYHAELGFLSPAATVGTRAFGMTPAAVFLMFLTLTWVPPLFGGSSVPTYCCYSQLWLALRASRNSRGDLTLLTSSPGSAVRVSLPEKWNRSLSPSPGMMGWILPCSSTSVWNVNVWEGGTAD